MSENSFTEIRTHSYGENIKNSFGGIIVGIVLFILSIIVLWCNEGHLAKQNAIANYADRHAIPTINTIIDNNNDNKLISTFGEAYTNESLSDGIITVPNALVLNRKVEMYQWKETKETRTKTKTGGSTEDITTYSYEKDWSEEQIDSSKFYNKSYSNPEFTLKSQKYNTNDGSFGAYRLSSVQTSAINNLIDYTNLPKNDEYTLSGNYYYKSRNINYPSIGDIRISYTYSPSGAKISVIGMQRPDRTITPMISKQGSIYIQYDGLLSQEELIQKYKHGNSITANIFRLLGFILMFIGLNMLLMPLAVLLSFIPVFKTIVSVITGWFVFLVSIVLSLIIIAAAWFFYRPVLTILLLIIAFAVIVLIKYKLKKHC